MPGIFFTPASRRGFFKASTAAVFAAGLARVRAGETETGALRVALLSDTHFPVDPTDGYRGFFPAENLKKTVPQVAESNSAAVILNGDAARLYGYVEDYQGLRTTLAPLAEKAPIIIGMGNHDNRENFGSVFPASPMSQAVQSKRVLVWDEPQVRFIILDSLLFTNKTPGYLGKAQRDWLNSFLVKSDGKPVVIFVHHTLGEHDGELMDADKLLAIVQPHAKVKAIFYGHSHVYSFEKQAGLHLVNLPAVGYNFNDREPVGWVLSEFRKDGADLTLRALGGNTEGDGKTKSIAWR